MPNEVITTDQLKYSRLVASKDSQSKDRWLTLYSWYPHRQHTEYGRIGQIYCESRHRYGDETFLKYARLKRLNNRHTFSHADALKILEAEGEARIGMNSECRVPVTTNGEYGRCKPTRMHYC